MSHVDEGALHAYLDGALDEYPAAEARRIREHVDGCAACADRLRVEQQVREQARAILGRAAPDVEVPTFEELRAYARASRPRPTSAAVRLYRLGWAASVVLALGTGWILRGGRAVQLMSTTPGGSASGSPAPVDHRKPVSGGPAKPRPEPAAATGQAGAGGSALEAGTGSSSGDPTPVPADQVPADADAPAREDVRSGPDGDALQRAAEPAPALDGTVAAGLPAPVVLAPLPTTFPPVPVTLHEKVTARPIEPPADASDRQAEVARRSAQGQVLTSAISADAPLDPEARTRDADAAEPDDVESASLVVPGLELIAVLPVSEGRTFAGMRALQRLENGDTLEVVHLAEGVPPSTLPPVRAGSREIVLERGAGWIVLRAPRTEAELLGLLQRLEAGG